MKRVARWLLIGLGTGVLAIVLWVEAPRGPASPETFLRWKGALTGVRILSVEDDGKTRTEEIILDGDRGLQVRALIRSPSGDPGPFPALVLLGGLHTGRRAARVAPVGEPLVIASIDYLRPPPSKISLPRALASLSDMKRGVEESVAATLLLLDHLESRPAVDSMRTVLAGGSLGALVAAVAGGIEPRFEGVALLYGGGNLREIAEANLPFGSRAARRVTAWALSPWLDPVDPLRFAPRISPRPLLLVNGRRDGQIPEACVRALFDEAGDPKRLIWLDTPHRVQGKPELAAEVARVVFTWMREEGLMDDAGTSHEVEGSPRGGP